MTRGRAKYVSDKEVKEESLFDDEPTPVRDETPKKKEFKNEDLIPCVSITVGGLYMTGIKSNEVYHWTNMGETTEVEYRDLLAEVRNHSFYVYEPAFIIQDDDFLQQHDDILVRYGQLYTPSDIESVLAMPAQQLETTLKQMPVGAQNAVRDLAMRKINDGSFDSAQRVRVLDSFFGTQMLLKLTQ